ncbi:MAG: hypothetical protein H7144_01295 [Burkholderiales bacterium]|nr:hypothetical protein [Phycisphaerae bacterium]
MLTIAGGIVVLAAVGGGLLLYGHKLPTRIDGSRAEQRSEIVAALATNQSVGDPALTRQVQPLLKRLGESLLKHDPSSMDQQFDFERMVKEIERLPIPPKISPKNRAGFAAGLKQGIRQQFSVTGTMGGWNQHNIRSVRPVLDAPGDVVVYVVLHQASGPSRMRFWLHKTNNWRVYDYEDLTIGLRISTIMGQMLGSVGSPAEARVIQDLQAIPKALVAINGGDFKAAEAALDSISDENLPPNLLATVYATRTSVALMQQDSAGALRFANRAIELNPDVVLTYLLKAAAHNALGAHEEALTAMKTYHDALGPTGLGSYQQAVALVALKRQSEALVVLQAGLADEPESIDCNYFLATLDSADAQAIFRSHAENRTFPAAAFRELCAAFDRNGSSIGLINFVEAQGPAQGDTIDVRFYRAAGLEYQKRYAEAAALFVKELKTEDAFYKDAVLPRYLTCMVAAGLPLEGYRATGQPEASFAHLCTALATDDPALAKLYEEHLERHPADAHAWDRKGLWLVRQDRFADAVEAYDQAIRQSLSPESIDGINARRMYALFKLGKGLETFRKLPSQVERFDQLASLFAGERQVTELAELIEVHSKAEPQSKAIAPWRGELAYLKKDYRHAITILRPLLDRPDDNLAWTISDRLVRSYSAIGEFEQALEAAGADAEKRDALHLTLIAAARGDVAATHAAVVRALRDGYDKEDMLDDPDIGPIVNTPPFAEVLNRLKPPATAPTSTLNPQPH